MMMIEVVVDVVDDVVVVGNVVVDVVDVVELVVEEVVLVVDVVELVVDVVELDVDVVELDVDVVELVDDVVELVVVVAPGAACDTTTGIPATTIVALRCAPPLGCTVRLTVADPVPVVGWTVSQSTKFCTFQPHVGPVVNTRLRCPPAASMEMPFALSE